MNPILFRAEVISPSVPLRPFVDEAFCRSSSSEPTFPEASDPERPSLRHLLIGPSSAVHLTIHRLHQLGYSEAGLWSPEIPFSSSQLTLTLQPGDVMRVLRRSLPSLE